MSFVPALPLSGVAGLRFLERTADVQKAAHARAPEIQRNIAYFAENIASIKTAEEFVADRKLMTVALGAFGLGGEIDKRAFIQKILEGGVEDTNSLANRLNNQGFRNITEAFRFDRNGFPTTGSPTLRDTVISNYLDQSYEISIGEQDESLRLALDFKRRAIDTAERGWFAIMGDLPVREVFQKALGLPDEISGIDVDKQKAMFEERASRRFGLTDLSQLSDPAMMDKIVTRYLLLDEAAKGPSASTPGYTALTLLSSAVGPGASLSLFQSST